MSHNTNTRGPDRHTDYRAQTNRTRGDLGPDNFCGEIKVLESDRFLFSQHLSNSGRDWASLMSGNVAAIMFTRVTVLTI